MDNNNPAPPGNAALVLLAGPPGTGKTTFARRLAPMLAALHLESDGIRRELFPTRTYGEAEHAAVFAEMERRAAAALAAGRVVIVDATNLRERHRRRFLRIAESREAPAVLVRLAAPRPKITARLRGPRAGASEATLEVYERLQQTLEPSRLPWLVVDTRFDLQPSLQLVCALCEQAR